MLIIVLKIALAKDHALCANNLILLLFIPGSLTACLYLLGKTLILPWYTPLFTVPILFGIFGTIFQRKSRNEALILGVIALPMLACLLLSTVQTMWAAINDLPSYQRFEEGARARKYIQVGETLYQKYPDATLLSSEIGGLGWGFGGYIADGAGLITPQAQKYHPMKIPEERSSELFGAIPVGIVTELKPEIIVSYDVFNEAFIRSEASNQYIQFIEPNFVEEDLLRSPDGTVFGSKHLNIFIRKDLLENN
jgi:hypothetical protein